MNESPLSAVKYALLAILYTCAVTLARSQTATTVQPSTAVSSILVAKQAAFQNSQILFANHNYSDGEAALEASNVRLAGTPEWHSESAGELLSAVFAFQARGDSVTMNELVQLALNQFSLAEQGYTTTTAAVEIANEKTALGYLYEHVIGDRAKAQAYYSQAIVLSSKPGLAAIYLAKLNRSLLEEAKKPGRASAP